MWEKGFRRPLFPVMYKFLTYPFMMKLSIGFTAYVILATTLALSLHMILINSAPYKLALEFINTSNTVQGQLGNISVKSLTYDTETGNSLSRSNNEGKAEFSFYTAGTKAEGVINISLLRTNDKWIIDKASFYEKNKGIKLK